MKDEIQEMFRNHAIRLHVAKLFPNASGVPTISQIKSQKEKADLILEYGRDQYVEMLEEARDQLTYVVEIWCAEPGTSDDCGMARRFWTEPEARRAFSTPFKEFAPWLGTPEQGGERWVRLIAPTYTLAGEPCESGGGAYRQIRDGSNPYPDYSRSERAMQAGMGLGIDAYNEHMGND